MNYLWDNKHFIITHFPIVLLLVSFLFDLAALIWKKKDWHTAALACLVLGTVCTIAAVLTGPKMMMQNSAVETHELYGTFTMYLAIVLSVVRGGIMLWKKRDIGRNPIYLIVALVAVVLVMYTAHLGGKMVHRSFEPGQFPQGMMGGGQGQGQGQGFPQQGDGQGQMPAQGQGQDQGQDGAAPAAPSTNQ
ncbi:putative membrane protein [Paenibacillus cellulosilyticus]|uniref:Putative membrane protein n=1 Tax=Paenibacillus cellulosilyticus TaxID=375489 RepID=A0A2V2Z196_9BACL|nr:DUF2231 domain-containing protein [Paenibacillus cellulosilyticus]PWW07311.1 putative membrane protein [Paenibacillus cellulosilyticus]QKS44503.1 DUF2231 domain-containing protein [Paenibacillus cellulosilyticus]